MAKRATPYGLKEVADVYFYDTEADITINSTGASFVDIVTTTATPLFIFDSLKVSSIEVSSEETTATGGRGNPELLSWSYGKEITFTMEDALFSMATLDLMFGAKADKDNSNGVKDSQNDWSIIVDGETFPGSYHVVGLTTIRNFENGVDIPFVFEIPKAKVNVGGTLTMEADGDPSTFEMTLKALKSTDKDALVKFHRIGVGDPSAATTHESDNISGT